MEQQNTLNDIKQTIVFNASIQKVWSVVSTAEELPHGLCRTISN